jgi:hypothetical protein
LDRFKITVLVEGGGAGPERRNIDPQSLKALYALHLTEVQKALPYLGDDTRKLKQLTSLPVKEYYNWDTVTRAYLNIRDANNIIFVFAHSD